MRWFRRNFSDIMVVAVGGFIGVMMLAVFWLLLMFTYAEITDYQNGWGRWQQTNDSSQ